MPSRPAARRPLSPNPDWEDDAVALLDQMRGRPVIKGPPNAGATVSALLKPILPPDGATLRDLKRRWVEIMGERLAQLTEPEKLVKRETGATLTIRAVASAAPFVQHQAPLLKERCALAGLIVAEITIKQGPLSKPPPANVRPLAKPLSPEEERALAAALASVPDDRLKEALARLARAVAQREAG
ncbi:MAG: DciA family protein [Caulobacterales bacterium]